MENILNAINVKDKNELEYVKGLHLDPDFNKIDPNCGEDLITQLARIKKLDKSELEKRLTKALVMRHLTMKYYEMIDMVLKSPEIPAEKKRSLVGMTHSPSSARKIPLFFVMLFDIVFFTSLYILLVPTVVSIGLCIAALLCYAFAPGAIRSFYSILVKRYFKILGWRE